VIAPPNGILFDRIFLSFSLFIVLVNRIKMDFSATRISTQDFTPEQIKTILADAKQQIEEEQRFIKSKKENFRLK
jgi:hypothetical protein